MAAPARERNDCASERFRVPLSAKVENGGYRTTPAPSRTGT
jgi:hypothetical protein